MPTSEQITAGLTSIAASRRVTPSGLRDTFLCDES